MHASTGQNETGDARPIGRRVAAFTLVEVLVVVLILGIAAAMVVPQMLKAGSLSIQAAARMVVSDIVFAQNEAIARQQTRQFVVDAEGNGYSVTDGEGDAVPAPWLGGTLVVDFDTDRRFQGVEIVQPDFGGSATLGFDELGTPTAGGTVDLITNGYRYRVTVTAFTGRVEVEPVNGG
jgi:general secretion pathway protein H